MGQAWKNHAVSVSELVQQLSALHTVVGAQEWMFNYTFIGTSEIIIMLY